MFLNVLKYLSVFRISTGQEKKISIFLCYFLLTEQNAEGRKTGSALS